MFHYKWQLHRYTTDSNQLQNQVLDLQSVIPVEQSCLEKVATKSFLLDIASIHASEIVVWRIEFWLQTGKIENKMRYHSPNRNAGDQITQKQG
jgi:hypothetical protein